MLSVGFPPIASPTARVLILGSLPGRISLDRGEYYANSQNAFWKIVAARVGQLPGQLPLDYTSRAAALVEHGIALWDVLAAATRRVTRSGGVRPPASPPRFHRIRGATV
jgi:hypoxanthine-DNA glycosylase